MKRTLAILFAAIMLLSLLTACGGGAPDPNAGLYKFSGAMGYSLKEYAEMADMTEEEAADMIQIELKDKGVVDLIFDGETTSGKWSLDGETLTFDDNGQTITGTLKDGVMEIELDGESVTLTKAE